MVSAISKFLLVRVMRLFANSSNTDFLFVPPPQGNQNIRRGPPGPPVCCCPWGHLPWIMVQAVLPRYPYPKIGLFLWRLSFFITAFLLLNSRCFPAFPRVMGGVEFLLILVGLGELLRAENYVLCDDDECCAGDQFVCLFGLVLGISEIIDIFWDALTINMILFYLVL